MADVTVEFGATDTGLDLTLKGIRESMKELETQQKTTAMSTDEVEKSLRELKKLQGMEKHFMDLSGETAKLADAQKIAAEATKKLAEEANDWGLFALRWNFLKKRHLQLLLARMSLRTR